jgi:transcriptional regulator with XRE-family HTH domain
MPARPRELRPDRSARDLFGYEMRRHREAGGLTLEGLGAVAAYSKSALARFETAEAMIPEDLPARLDTAFGTDGLFERLYELARKEAHPDKYRRHMELEALARVIDTYAGHLMPGLLQTPDYARAVFRKHNPGADAEQIEELVTARMSRQALLRSAAPPDFSAILDEAVIRRPVGGSVVMRVQFEALLPLIDTTATLIQVIPFAHGEHALLGGSLDLLTLPDGSDVAYEESIDSGTLMEDERSVRQRRRAYDVMRAHALSPSQTAALIHEAMEALPDEQYP